MGKLNKFENVDVFASLEAIMKQNTGFYQSDFDIDKKIIAEKAASQNPADKTLLWLSRPSGTYCFRERDVFISDTAPHNTGRSRAISMSWTMKNTMSASKTILLTLGR